MKEELINKILERIKEEKVTKEILACLDEVVLERLCLINDTKELKKTLLKILDNDLDTKVSLPYINIRGLAKGLDYNNYFVNKLTFSNIDSKLKAEALRKMAMAKSHFQLKYIYYIYENKEIEYKDLIADIILKCNKEFQVVGVYSIFSNIETEKEKECIAEYLELAKLIAKEKNRYKANIYTNLDWNLDILDLGLLLPVAKLISKCKCENQAKNMYNYLNDIDSKNAPYILKNAMYFLKTTDEDKLESLSKYLTYSLKQNLLVEEEKVNLIVGARKKFNSDAIEGSLTSGHLIEMSLDNEAAQILNNSRKEYNVNYASKLISYASIDSLSGAMIVNESETKYKAEKVYGILFLYETTDEIDKSLEFAALINSVHTKVEIDLIYLLSQNSYLNKLGIALPIARVIANATDCEEDVIKIWECLKEEENKVNAIKGFVSLLQNINLKNRQKAENIINLVLLKAQNKPMHFELPQEESTVEKIKISTKIKKLVKKNK